VDPGAHGHTKQRPRLQQGRAVRHPGVTPGQRRRLGDRRHRRSFGRGRRAERPGAHPRLRRHGRADGGRRT
jgi:hypothetical protein